LKAKQDIKPLPIANVFRDNNQYGRHGISKRIIPGNNDDAGHKPVKLMGK